MMKVARGKPLANNDLTGLTEFYYTINDLLVTLLQLNYQSDLFSSDLLPQATRKLPLNIHTWWAEYCLKIRRTTEPNLIHFVSWLQDRVLVSKESYYRVLQYKNKSIQISK